MSKYNNPLHRRQMQGRLNTDLGIPEHLLNLLRSLPNPPAKYLPSSAIASLKASLALNIKDKPILDYGAAVFHQEARELEDAEYWHKVTGGESDNWPPCKQEGDI